MLEFKKVTFEDKELLQSCYNACGYESCEYSAGIKLFWNRFYPYEYAVSADGALIVKYEESGNTVFDMPVFREGSDSEKNGGKYFGMVFDEPALKQLNAALDEIDEYCVKNEIVPVFSDVPAELLGMFAVRYNFTKFENYREAADYIYRIEDLRDFKGRHYSGQRNHINKFKSLYPDYKYRELLPDEDLSVFWAAYYGENTDDSESYIQEKAVAMEMAAKHSQLETFVSGAIEINGQLAAFCIGEILGNRVIVHVEKALREYEGVYPVMVSEYLKHLPEGIEFVNREDDSSDKGLRISKLQYRPYKLLSKYVILIQSELLYVDDVPCIKTKRLTLDEISKADAAVYSAICMDDERNKYWGYDYKADLPDEYAAAVLPVCPDKTDAPISALERAENCIPANYFVEAAANDFARRMCLSLAVRLDGKMIGEAVLYEADYKGGIEIGCRLLKEYECRGFGREAMEAVSDWAIYKAGFRKVKAKCFKENAASYKMLASFMKQIADDDKYFYFEKNC